jgi:hypothetical protein
MIHDDLTIEMVIIQLAMQNNQMVIDVNSH